MSSSTPPLSANVAVLRGELVNEPVRRDLPSGSVVVQFDLTTRVHDGDRFTNVSVPVAWTDPSSSAVASLTTGCGYVIVGSVRRRFFRVGGATQSRTEVVAEQVIPVRRRKQAATVLVRTAERIVASST
ncbi:MAG: single-stranded DNA-binding protein [Ilumatobacteraceae bacterium]